MENAPLVETLQLAAAALQSLVDALEISESERIKFTGEWSRFGTLTIGEVLDRTNAALDPARCRLNTAAPDMLAALKGIARNAALDDAWLAPVRAAIAKATEAA